MLGGHRDACLFVSDTKNFLEIAFINHLDPPHGVCAVEKTVFVRKICSKILLKAFETSK